ncbi:MAG: hypothetical protein AAGK09_07300 [Planctomycetota bacterium]
MAASVRMICPNLLCRAVLAAPANARGKKVRCRACGMRVQVPGAASAKPDASTASPGNAEESTGKAA